MNQLVIPFPKMNRTLLRTLVADLASTSGRVKLSRHAREEMNNDDLTFPQLLVCLRKGNWSEEPYPTVRGGWHCTLTCLTAGESITVAAEVFPDRIKIITCWLDKGG